MKFGFFKLNDNHYTGNERDPNDSIADIYDEAYSSRSSVCRADRSTL